MPLGQQQSRASGGWRHTFVSLNVRDFRNLWFGVLSMMAGLQMQAVARGYLTYDITGSPFLLGLVSVGFAVPMLILSLFGGAIADRVNQTRIIQVCQGCGAVAALAIAISISTDTITWIHLFAASVINGVLFAFMVPSRTALIPQLVGKELVTNALALIAGAMSATTLLAPTVAGSLYALLGPGGVYYVISATQLAAVLFTGRVNRSARVRGTPSKARRAMMGDILEGLKHIRANPLVIVLLVLALSTALLAMPFRSLLPIFVVDIYHRGPEALGLLVSVMGVGSLFGSLFVAAIGSGRRGLLLISGGIISGIGLLVVSFVPNYLVGACVMALLGLGDSLRRSLNQALILELVEEEYRGRVSSVYAMNFGLMPLAVLPAGVIAEYFGGQVAVAALSIPLLVVCFVILITQKRLRTMM